MDSKRCTYVTKERYLYWTEISHRVNLIEDWAEKLPCWLNLFEHKCHWNTFFFKAPSDMIIKYRCLSIQRFNGVKSILCSLRVIRWSFQLHTHSNQHEHGYLGRKLPKIFICFCLSPKYFVIAQTLVNERLCVSRNSGGHILYSNPEREYNPEKIH